MKASTIMEAVIGKEFMEGWHGMIDSCKAGDPACEVDKIAVCFAATPEVLRQAANWGAQLLITHEPTYYNHLDEFHPSALSDRKKELVEESGLTIYRYHDSMHFQGKDAVGQSFLELVPWKGTFDGTLHFTFDTPTTPAQIIEDICTGLKLPCLRRIGRRDGTVKKVGLFLGARDESAYEPFFTDDTDLAICGEACEWQFGEPVREAAQFGMQKTMLLLGHVQSEKFAMKSFAKEINGKFDGIPAQYFECGDLFTYDR
ncbi:MAG: Nif3-like dinuclear metal center hexameric protein [Clostridiales bacterium]|nr:Nif3-like dinuclear metal center hexameric protein [Clostridiales bacterium]